MAAVSGRSSGETRTVTVTTTSASTALTGAAGTFNKGDVGAVIAAASGITAPTTIATVTNSTTATLSQNATASGSRSATIGAGTPGVYGYRGWSPESDDERATLISTAAGGAGVSDPTRILAPNVARSDYTRNR